MSGRTIALRVVVRGEVQGVFFRDSTRRQARRHGVVGWVRNDPEGTVTAHLEGPDEAVEAVLAWVRAGGPPAAQVADVAVEEVELEDLEGFAIRRS